MHGGAFEFCLCCIFYTTNRGAGYALLRKEKKLKQLIVLISTVVLGIAIAALVLGFRDPAQKLENTASLQLEAVIQECSGSAVNFKQ